jgi:hypothetical protein
MKLSKTVKGIAVIGLQQRPMNVHLNSGRNVSVQEVENTQQRRVKPFLYIFPMT